MRIISKRTPGKLFLQDLRFILKKFKSDPMPPYENKTYWIKNRIVVNLTFEKRVQIWKSNDNGFVLSGEIAEADGGLEKP